MKGDNETVAFWRHHVDGWKNSTLTQRAYCEAHGLARRTFVRWRMQFKVDDAIAERLLTQRGRRRRRTEDSPSANHSAMAPKQPALGFPRPNRRRQFPDELKRQIVMETLAPGMSVSAVARLYGVTPPCVFRWRKLMGLGASNAPAAFASVRISEDAGDASQAPIPGAQLPLPSPASAVERPSDSVEIELSGGARLRFASDIDPQIVRRMIDVVEGERS